MNYHKYKLHCSAPRLQRYYDAVNGDTTKTILLYNLNMKLSQAFFLPLTVFEVTLRNQLCRVLSSHFGDSDWIIHQKNGFMSDTSLTQKSRRTGLPRTEDFIKSQVLKAEAELKKKGLVVTSGRVIAEQSLAFWVSFFNPDYFRILRSSPIKVFTQLPAGKGRNTIANSLDQIRRLRNRIFHHEPICFASGSHVIDTSYASNLKVKIVEILDWIDQDICLEFSEIHEIDVLVNQIKSI